MFHLSRPLHVCFTLSGPRRCTPVSMSRSVCICILCFVSVYFTSAGMFHPQWPPEVYSSVDVTQLRQTWPNLAQRRYSTVVRPCWLASLSHKISIYKIDNKISYSSLVSLSQAGSGYSIVPVGLPACHTIFSISYSRPAASFLVLESVT